MQQFYMQTVLPTVLRGMGCRMRLTLSLLPRASNLSSLFPTPCLTTGLDAWMAEENQGRLSPPAHMQMQAAPKSVQSETDKAGS